MTAQRLTRSEWDVIDSALSVYEAMPPGGDRDPDWGDLDEQEQERRLDLLKRARSKVWQRLGASREQTG